MPRGGVIFGSIRSPASAVHMDVYRASALQAGVSDPLRSPSPDVDVLRLFDALGPNEVYHDPLLGNRGAC